MLSFWSRALLRKVGGGGGVGGGGAKLFDRGPPLKVFLLPLYIKIFTALILQTYYDINFKRSNEYNEFVFDELRRRSYCKDTERSGHMMFATAIRHI